MKALLFLMRRLRVLPMAGRTLPSLSSPSPWLSSLILLSMGGTLLVDIVTPLGIPLWVPYLVPLLLSFWLPFWYAPLLVALGCSSLTLLGWALSPPGADSAWGLLNRVFGIAGLGITALLLQHVKQITEQREHALQARLAAEEVGRVREEEFRAIFELAGAGNAQVEPGTGRFRRVNRKFCAMTGYAADELLAMTYHELLAPEAGEPAAGWQQFLAEALTEYTGEVRYRRKDGSLHWGLLTAARPAEPRVPAPLIITVMQDMTEQKQLEQTLREMTAHLEQRVEERTRALQTANERLQEQARLKSAFVSIVSHEIRTPLTAMHGYIDNMLYGLGGPLTEKQETYLRRVLHSIQRLTRMIRDLLDFSRIESGHAPLRLAPVVLSDLIAEVVESFEPMASKKLVTLQVYVPPDLPGIEADRDKLHQILTNLLENALKFTEPRGEVDIEARWREEGWVQLCIRDTGYGIASDELPHIFESFYQGGGEQREQGLGLGLAITKKLVELHGGRIWVDSTPGTGSRFYIALLRRPPLLEPRGSS